MLPPAVAASSAVVWGVRAGMFLLLGLLAQLYLQGVQGEPTIGEQRFQFADGGSPMFESLDNKVQVTFNLLEDNRNLYGASVCHHREDLVKDICLGNLTSSPGSEKLVQILTDINACETYTRLYIIKYETPDVKHMSIWFEYNRDVCARGLQPAVYGAMVAVVVLVAAALGTAWHWRRRRAGRITSVQANPQYGQYGENFKETELYDRNIDYYGADSGIEIWVADSNPAYRR
jgi:hypothetical protein